MGLTVLIAVALVLAGLLAAEPVLRWLVARRIVIVLAGAVALPDGASAAIQPGRVTPGLLRRHLAAAIVTAPRLVVGELVLHDVDVLLAT